MNHSIPLLGADLFRGIETYTIAPKMWHSPHLESKIVFISVFRGHQVRVGHKLEVELVEVCSNVDTLQLVIVVLVDQDEVRVDLNSTVFTKHYANLVLLLTIVFYLADGTILEQRRNCQLRLIYQHSKLDKRYSILFFVELQSHETHLPSFALLKYNRSYISERLDRDNFEGLTQIKQPNFIFANLTHNRLFAVVGGFFVYAVLCHIELEDIVAIG